jgi:hypothetical protein
MTTRDLRSVQAALVEFLHSPPGKRIARWSRRLLLIGVFAFLIYQLSGIGWGAIWHSLPEQPLFYVIFLALYAQQPFFYTLAYRLGWRFRFTDGLAALFKMCVYNNDVIGNLGEVYLFLWAEKRLKLSRVELLRTIKDNAIVCWVWDTIFSLGMPLVLLVSGHLATPATFSDGQRLFVYAGGAVAVVFLLGTLALRRTILSLSLRHLAWLSAVHVARLGLLTVMAICQWVVVLPDVPWDSWWTMVSLRNLVNWIPVLPSNDLLFVGAGVELSEALGIPAAPFAGMLLMTSALSKLLNASLFGLLTMFERGPVEKGVGSHSSSHSAPGNDSRPLLSEDPLVSTSS